MLASLALLASLAPQSLEPVQLPGETRTPDVLVGAAWGDFDADGLPDLYVLTPAAPDRLFENVGDGTFEDVTASSGLPTEVPSRSASWHDVDADGHADLLLVGSDGRLRLFRGIGQASFGDATHAFGLAEESGVLSAEWFDYDRDGRADLRLVGLGGTRLLHHAGASGFAPVRLPLPAVGFTPLGASLAGESESTRDAPELDELDRAGPGSRSSGAAVLPPRGPGGSADASGIALRATRSGGGSGPMDLITNCAGLLVDVATNLCDIPASSVPTLGMLYPLGTEFNIDAATGNVGLGTMAPSARLHATTPGSQGAYVETTATAGATIGVTGLAASPDGRGVYGRAIAQNGTNTGVWGLSRSSSGRGVYGEATSASGSTTGVLGAALSSTGTGVRGEATATSGSAVGVRGTSGASQGAGVFGQNTNTGSGFAYGVHGQAPTRGIYGEGTGAGSSVTGVSGITHSSTGTGVFGGYTGTPTASTGVRGVGNTGVKGEALSGGTGVFGGAASGTADFGVDGVGSIGVRGRGTGLTGSGVGIRGEHSANPQTNYGELGLAGIGIRAQGDSAAGDFLGNLFVSGGTVEVQEPAKQFGMSIAYDNGQNRLEISGRNLGSLVGPHMTIHRSSGAVDINGTLDVAGAVDFDGPLDVVGDFGSGVNGTAVFAESTNPVGIGLWSRTHGSDATMVADQRGTGDIFRGFEGGTLVFRVLNSGRCVTTALQITGGGDLVEGFDAGDEECEPGTVLSIDPESTGKLASSRQPYDPKVAGVVSGAGGVEHGIRMGQEGVLDGDVLVAMAGRVYVRCSTENGAIRPGDRLTTASLSGHAMKATDPELSPGAVIGKAMTGLDEGTGLVLVLVNLQ